MAINTTLVLAISLVLFLVALPLTSFGAMEENEVIWGAGLVLLVVAGILPPATRFIGADDDKDKDKDEDKGDTPEEDAGDGDDEAKQDRRDTGDRREGDGREGDRRGASDASRRAGTPEEPPPHPRAIEPPPGTEDRRTMRPRVEEQRQRAGDDGRKPGDRKGDKR
jgi:hypothetical protein